MKFRDAILDGLFMWWLGTRHKSAWVPTIALSGALVVCTYLSWRAGNGRAILFFATLIVILLAFRVWRSHLAPDERATDSNPEPDYDLSVTRRIVFIVMTIVFATLSTALTLFVFSLFPFMRGALPVLAVPIFLTNFVMDWKTLVGWDRSRRKLVKNTPRIRREPSVTYGQPPLL